MPRETRYPISHLKRFICDDPEPVIAFYGGEPLLNVRFIEEVMEGFPNARFVIQSNGLLAKVLEPQYWLRFKAVLLSIDGRRMVTDHYRGVGVYDRVVDSARWLREIGFRNDLIARMTVSELTDIFLDARHILSLDLFDHIHWQLNVIWSSLWKDFNSWLGSSYLPGINRLVRLWIEEARKGRALGLVPFVALLRIMVEDRKIGCPPCGAGIDSLSVLTDGTVIACPIAVDIKWARLGNLRTDSKLDMINRVRINKPCTSCNYLAYCGGRCLYAHYERLWGKYGFKRICGATIHTVEELAKVKTEVLGLIKSGVIPKEHIEYPPFNNTTEIIP